MRRQTTRLIIVGLIICSMALIFAAGCTQAPASTTTAPSPTATTPAGPKTGGILKVASNADAFTIGYVPKMMASYDFAIGKTAIESLMRWNAKGEQDPWLAESWKIDGPSKSITFNLRKGVKFHDGTDFNAEAVKWNLERFMAAGRTEVPKGMTVAVVDDYTVKCTLPAWDSTVMAGLTWNAGHMTSPAAWKNAPGAATDADRDAWAANNPVGTGPFQFVNWAKTTKIVYKKFDGYWNKGKPYLDGLEWHVIADPMTSEATFKAKEVDVSLFMATPTAKGIATAGYKIGVCELGALMCHSLVPNSIADGPLKDVKVRQAMGYALDKKGIANAVYGQWGLPVDQLATPTSSGNSPDFKGFAYDLDKAKKLLAEAGYANGFKTKLEARNLPEDVQIATAVQSQLAKINITVEVVSVAIPKHLQDTAPGGSFEGMILMPLRTDNDGVLALARQFGSKAVQLQATVLKPSEIDSAFDAGRAATDPASKIKVVQQLQQLICEKYCLFNPIVLQLPLMAKQDYVKDDGFFAVWQTQYTPESAWLSK